MIIKTHTVNLIELDNHTSC